METFLNFSGLQFNLFMKLATPKSHFKMMICILHPLHFHYHIYPFCVSAEVSVLDFCALTPAVKDSFIIITIQNAKENSICLVRMLLYLNWIRGYSFNFQMDIFQYSVSTFLGNFAYLYILKTLENQRFSYLFRWYKMEHWPEMGYYCAKYLI